MTNSYRAVQPKLQEIEAIVNAVPIKNQDPEIRQIGYMINKHLASLTFWVERAQKHEAEQ
jgi:hypothetical protein